MSEWERFVDADLRGEHSLSELCRRWRTRGLAGTPLMDRSRRPRTSPRAVSAWLEDAIIAARGQRPRWGPKKLRAVLARANPGVVLPAISTFALLLHRNGLARPRRRRQPPPFSAPFSAIRAPNARWCVDFKGHVPVGQTRGHPLTVMDAYNRYRLACVALRRPDGDAVRRAFEGISAAYGLPAAIRTGIRHERIAPGHPEQNGRHERMHLTLTQATTMPPAHTLRAQPRAFDRFRAEYNQKRPHGALDDRAPADLYTPSPRVLPEPPLGAGLRVSDRV